MAYADQKQNRAVALGSVAFVHIGLGAALLTGLAVKFSPVVPKPPTTTYDVPVEAPPEPVPPPPEPRDEVTPREATTPPVNVPVPEVRTSSDVVLTTTTETFPPPPPPPPIRLEPAPPPPPPAPPANLSRGLQPRGDQGDWFPQDSYPSAARRAGAEGRVSVAIDVGADGRVTGCRVVGSSGDDDLDAATCRLATRNGRFIPALNAAGEPVPGSVTLRPVRWRLDD